MASHWRHVVIRRSDMPARAASLLMLPPPQWLPSPPPRLRPPRPRLRRTPPRPRPRPATVAKEASPLAATTKASSPEATTGVFPSTPARSLPDHSGKAHLVVARPPCPRPPPQPATPCPRPPPRPPPLAAPTGHPPRNLLSPSRCRRGRVPQQGPPPYPNGHCRWDGSRADMATAAVGMTAVSSGTDVASTSGAAEDGSQ